MVLMATRKGKDRHTVPVMTIRLGEPARSVLKRAAKLEDRTITAIINRALKLYAKENKYPWTEEDQAPES